MTYNGYFRPKDKSFNAFGGYSTHIVAKEAFLLHIPASDSSVKFHLLENEQGDWATDNEKWIFHFT